MGRIGPIGLRSDDREAMPGDETAGDRGAGAVELGSAVRGLSKQHDPGVAKPVKHRPKSIALEIRQRLCVATDQTSQIGIGPTARALSERPTRPERGRSR